MSMSTQATRGKINRMLKYFRRKNVRIRYEYNDSQGGHRVREKDIFFDSFEIRGAWTYFHIVFKNGQEIAWEQELDNGWDFIGLGKLMLNNSGPRCYFTITPTGA